MTQDNMTLKKKASSSSSWK